MWEGTGASRSDKISWDQMDPYNASKPAASLSTRYCPCNTQKGPDIIQKRDNIAPLYEGDIQWIIFDLPFAYPCKLIMQIFQL